jgi:PAS domain S-box-containing protein
MTLRLPLFLKVALLMVGLGTLPLAMVGIKILRLNRDSLQYEVLRYHTHLAQSLADKLNNSLTGMEEQLRFVVTSVKSVHVSWSEKQSILQSLVDASPSFALIAVLSPQGEEITKVYSPDLEPALASAPALISHREVPLFKTFLQAQGRVLEIFLENGHPRLKLYYPLETPGGRHAIFISYSLENFWKEILGIKVGRSGYCFLVDKDGLPLAHPDPSVDRTSLKTVPIVASALAGNIGASEFSDGGSRWVGASAPVPRLGGAVVTRQSREEAFESALRGERTAALWLLISAFLAAALAYVFARQLTRPIFSIIQAAREVRLEEQRFPEPVALKTRDELGDLVDTFNAMTGQLRAYAAMQVERLLMEKTKTEAIVYSINDGLVMMDHQGLIEFINTRAREILNISADAASLMHKPLWDFIPHTEALEVLRELFRRPEVKEFREIGFSAGGQARVFEVSTEPVRTPAKEDIGIVMIFHDITLEKELDQMKENFLHSITHDLRNPLASVRGFLKLLLTGFAGPVNDHQKKMLTTIDRASNRLMGMVNDILDLAKLEAGKMELNLSPTDLAAVAQNVVDLLRSQTDVKNVQLVTDISPLPFPWVLADAQLVERLLINLAGNAVKFTPESGKITIELRENADRISGAVADTGEGIPRDYLDKIFNKFQQVAGQRKGGTGLGLTICKYIVEGHGGEIGVESEPGHGSRFHFWIPKKLALAEGGTASAPAQTPLK